MSEEFRGTPQQISFVSDLAEEVYKEIVESPSIPKIPIPIHRGPYCQIASDMMIAKLRDAGFPALPRDYYGMLRHRHIFLGNDWIADPTWQQRFHDTKISWVRRLILLRTVQVPRVLVARIPELPSLLSKYGVDSRRIPTWTQAEIQEIGATLY